MKKIFPIILICTLFFVGCSFGGGVETIHSWSFQQNDDTSDYSLFFGFLNAGDKPVTADANVDITITSDNGEVLYTASKRVTKDDFSYYTSAITGEQLLANIRIKASDIEEGTSPNGTVAFVVSGDDFVFDEIKCEATNCLPIKEVTVSTVDLPIVVEQQGIMGGIESKLEITDVSYEMETILDKVSVQFVISGQKIYGEGGLASYDMFAYKLYDSEGYLVDSGNVMLTSLSMGDKFKDDTVYIYDLKPGENYTLELTGVEW